jgi:nucleotide-binding universal stress UspA family protein
VTIVIIIGSSQHRLHHAAGSVAASLMHEHEFPLLLVPPVKNAVRENRNA